jgi:uncharacterized membrane protein YphA (DoxX/SURF4 family)
VTLGEFFGGLGLLVGCLTRVAAGGIGIIMLGAIVLVGALADSYGSLRAFYGKNFWQLAAGLPSWGA